MKRRTGSGDYKAPLVSIVMPTYNRSRLISRAIKSALSQSYRNFELIIVDGNSTDNTSSVVKSFKDPRITYHKQKANYGMLSGKNKGLDAANGEYVCFLDDDDELVPDALKTALESFKIAPKKARLFWFPCFDSHGKITAGPSLDKAGFVSYEEILCEKITWEAWPIMYRPVIGSSRFDERLWGAEVIFWLDIFRKFEPYYVPKALRIYHREHGGNVCRFENQLKHVKQFVLNNEVFLEKFGSEQMAICPKAYGRRLAVLGFWHIMNGQKKEGQRQLVKSLKYNFSLQHLALYICSHILNKKQIAFIYGKLR